MMLVEDRLIDVGIASGLPRVLRHRSAFPTPRAPDGCNRWLVKYPDAHMEDIPLPDGTVHDDRPPVLLELSEK